MLRSDRDKACKHRIKSNILQYMGIWMFHLDFWIMIFRMKCILLSLYMFYIMLSMKGTIMKLHHHKTWSDSRILMWLHLKIDWECCMLNKWLNLYMINSNMNIFGTVK